MRASNAAAMASGMLPKEQSDHLSAAWRSAMPIVEAPTRPRADTEKLTEKGFAVRRVPTPRAWKRPEAKG